MDKLIDKALQATNEVIDETNKKKMEEEKAKKYALRIQREQEIKAEQFREEEKTWEQGILCEDPERFKEYLAKGHKPTYDSCGGRREYYYSMALDRYSFYKNTNFEEIFESACAHGLEKSDAEKLLKFAFTPKAVNILVDHGGADIQNYPIDKVALLYDEVTGRKDVVIGHVHDGWHGADDVWGFRSDTFIADGIESAVHEILKRGYDISKSPQHAEKLKSLLVKMQERQKTIEREKRDLERKELKEKLQKHNGEFYQVDKKRDVILYNPDNNNYGQKDNNFNETATNMVELANKTGKLVEAKFNGAQFQVKPGMTIDQADNVYNIALRELHFQVNYDVYSTEIRKKVQKHLREINHEFNPNSKSDRESKAKLSQDKDNNIMCTNDDGSLRWVWNPRDDVLTQYKIRAGCAYSDFSYDGLTDNKISSLRYRIANKADKVLGTKLAKKKIAKPLKKLEKAVSDKLLGKTRE